MGSTGGSPGGDGRLLPCQCPRIVPPQEGKDGDESQGCPLVTRQAEPNLWLGPQIFREKAVDKIADEINFDELTAKETTAEKDKQHDRHRGMKQGLVNLRR